MAVAVAEEITKHRLQSVGIAGLSTIVSIADEHLLRDSAPGVELVDATSLLQDAKELKSADDVAGSREALKLALSAYVHAPDLLAPGTRAQDVVAELERVLRAGGATELLVFVEAGPHIPQRVSDTTFSDGDLVTVLVEAADRHGYWVEVGGLFALGQLSPAAQNLADASYEALDAVRQRAKPGTPVADLSETVSGIASERGLDVQLSLGHGVGIDHDRPTLSPRSEELVREGHLLSVHPSIWDPREQLATMVADAFWVEAAGATRLTDLRYETTVLS
jgi:Xaa-Pro aminopeptidase